MIINGPQKKNYSNVQNNIETTKIEMKSANKLLHFFSRKILELYIHCFC